MIILAQPERRAARGPPACELRPLGKNSATTASNNWRRGYIAWTAQRAQIGHNQQQRTLYSSEYTRTEKRYVFSLISSELYWTSKGHTKQMVNCTVLLCTFNSYNVSVYNNHSFRYCNFFRYYEKEEELVYCCILCCVYSWCTHNRHILYTALVPNSISAVHTHSLSLSLCCCWLQLTFLSICWLRRSPSAA